MAKRKTYKKYKKNKTISTSAIVLTAIFVSFFALRAVDEWLSLGLFAKFDAMVVQWTKQVTNQKPPVSFDPNADFSVHFIDVGQGDCTLILSDGHTILIDAGENDKGDEVLAYLDDIGVQKIDLMIATHPHSDHIGGLDTVIQGISVKEVLMPPLKSSVVPTTKTYKDLLMAVKEKNITLKQSKVLEEYRFGNGKLTVLGPVANYDELNNTSLVARFDYGELSVLLTGDMEADAERDLLASGASVSADVLKLGHHGSSTSTSDAFLQAVGPRICIAECGEANEYGHPHEEIIERVSSYGAAFYRTDLYGHIVLSAKDGALDVSTQKQVSG